MSKPEYKGTKGKWIVPDELYKHVKTEDGLNVAIITISGDTYQLDEKLQGESWLEMRERTRDERVLYTETRPRENAKIIAAAGNLAQKYGSLEELERQRNELFKLSKGLIEDLRNLSGYIDENPDQEGYLSAVEEFLKSIEIDNNCDVCGSENTKEYPHIGLNCEDCNPLNE